MFKYSSVCKLYLWKSSWFESSFIYTLCASETKGNMWLWKLRVSSYLLISLNIFILLILLFLLNSMCKKYYLVIKISWILIKPIHSFQTIHHIICLKNQYPFYSAKKNSTLIAHFSGYQKLFHISITPFLWIRNTLSQFKHAQYKLMKIIYFYSKSWF